MTEPTLIINGRDFSSRLSSYRCSKSVSYANIIKTMDGKEHAGRRSELYCIDFTLLPYTDGETQSDYSALNANTFSVTFSNPYFGGSTSTYTMRLDSDLEAEFALVSITGDRYYKGGTISLIETAV